MDLANLQAFVEVARLGSFSTAAERLYLSQPAISKRIAALEDELNTLLFDRVGRKITLTATGTALLPRARQLLNDAVDLKRMATELSGQIAGPLTMATSHHIGLHRLPVVLRDFTRDHPDVSLDIRFMEHSLSERLAPRRLMRRPDQPVSRIWVLVAQSRFLYFRAGAPAAFGL